MIHAMAKCYLHMANLNGTNVIHIWLTLMELIPTHCKLKWNCFSNIANLNAKSYCKYWYVAMIQQKLDNLHKSNINYSSW